MLKQTISQDSLESHMDSIFSPRFFVSKIYLITRRVCTIIGFWQFPDCIGKIRAQVFNQVQQHTHTQPIFPLIFCGNLFTIDHRSSNQEFRHTFNFMTPNIMHAFTKILFHVFYKMRLSNQALFLSLEKFHFTGHVVLKPFHDLKYQPITF